MRLQLALRWSWLPRKPCVRLCAKSSRTTFGRTHAPPSKQSLATAYPGLVRCPVRVSSMIWCAVGESNEGKAPPSETRTAIILAFIVILTLQSMVCAHLVTWAPNLHCLPFSKKLSQLQGPSNAMTSPQAVLSKLKSLARNCPCPVPSSACLLCSASSRNLVVFFVYDQSQSTSSLSQTIGINAHLKPPQMRATLHHHPRPARASDSPPLSLAFTLAISCPPVHSMFILTAATIPIPRCTC